MPFTIVDLMKTQKFDLEGFPIPDVDFVSNLAERELIYAYQNNLKEYIAVVEAVKAYQANLDDDAKRETCELGIQISWYSMRQAINMKRKVLVRQILRATKDLVEIPDISVL